LRDKLKFMEQRPQLRYSRDGLSVAVQFPGDEYWYRFDHPTVDTPEYGQTFRCVPGTFDEPDENWADPFTEPRLRSV
jgi:hypothetical protein